MKTRNTTFTIVAVLAAFTVLFQACKSDSGPKDLNVESMMVGEADLNGATAPSDVPTDASIVVTFNTDINEETATTSNVTLTQDYDGADVEIALAVDGPTLTITPVAALGSGTLYSLELTSGLLNNDDQPLASTTRTFTTAGTFSPAGIVAHWTFENSADDVVGSFDPAASGVVDITYTASRNDAAGTAATFNGNTSIIEIPNGDDLLAVNDMTLSFWMKTDSDHLNADGNPTGHFVMGLGAFYGLQYEVFGGYDGSKFAIQYEYGPSADAESGAEDMWFPSEATDNTNGGWQGWTYAKSLTADQMMGYLKDTWTMVTFSFNSSTKVGKMYFNGELMKSFDFNLWPDGDNKQTVTGLYYAGQEPDVVNELAFGFIQSRAGTMWDTESWGGYDFPGANHFKGQLDDIKVYHKTLTDDEIRLMYESEE